MKVAIALLALVAVAAAAPLLSGSEYKTLFASWAAEHGKTYESESEANYRMGVFAENMDFIIKRRLSEATHTVAMNKFGDLTNDEFRALYINGISDIQAGPTGKHGEIQYPASINWVTKGAVTPVKNQGQCGSCWAFSAVGAIEGAGFLKTGVLTSLSEQNFVDCVTADQGCNGGLMQDAFAYAIQAGGICTEAAYPYTAQTGTCQAGSCPLSPQSAIKSYTSIIANNETDLTAGAGQQPVSVAVDASGMDWQFYSGGVLSDNCGTDLDHGVLLAGYATLNGADYYQVKNSWGADWGAQGYIYLKRVSKNQSGPGQCGIAKMASYPTF